MAHTNIAPFKYDLSAKCHYECNVYLQNHNDEFISLGGGGGAIGPLEDIMPIMGLYVSGSILTGARETPWASLKHHPCNKNFGIDEKNLDYLPVR